MKIISLFLISLAIISCKQQNSTYPDLLLNKDTNLVVTSSDTSLVSIFNWAVSTSNNYVGSNTDPVGPWYEAALPGREAFCIRDVSHQCIGAEIIGHGKQNVNMFTRFVENISASKDYCSYWEIDRYNKPALADYVSDSDFWYNLNANFDIIDACYKLYQWTGNPIYINDERFTKFFQLSMNEYIDRWQLQVDKIMDRSAVMNTPLPIRNEIKFKGVRGLPSYEESEKDLTVSIDLLAMICNAYRINAKIQKMKGDDNLNKLYLQKAEAYSQLVDSLWWNASSQNYYSYYKSDKMFKEGTLSPFMLWYGLVNNPNRIRQALNRIATVDYNIETMSYLPVIFYRFGENSTAYSYFSKIYTNSRREYPEASSGTIEGVVRGMCGVEVMASEHKIMTCPRLTDATCWISVENIPVYAGLISIRHESSFKTSFANKSSEDIVWKATYQGQYKTIEVNGNLMKTSKFLNEQEMEHSYIEVTVKPGTCMTATVTDEND